MKIIFFGNTSFGVPTLNKLKESDLELLSTVTNKDIYKSRNKIIETPIKKWSKDNNINAIEQNDINNLDFINTLSEYNADLFIVIAYKILPKSIFTLPRYGTMNLHASLLPKYRGAAPIQRAILNGETETGVSTFIIDKKIDTGNIVMQKSVSMHNENYGQLHDRLSIIGSDLVISSIKHIQTKKQMMIQPNSSTYAPKIKKSETQINWEQESTSIVNMIRAFSPSPGAYTYLNEKRVRIIEASVASKSIEKISPGTIKVIDKEILVGTSDAPISLKKLQMEGRAIVNHKSFINGYLNTKYSDLIFERR